MIHPARQLAFAELAGQMAGACAEGLVFPVEGEAGLRLYCYTRHCVYERAWTPVTVLARGLILDHRRARVVATPFPKFFNVGESGGAIPDRPFETFEKVDGSLIVIYHHDGAWRTATKGAFQSPQAIWAAGRLAQCDLRALIPGCTYLAEAIYPENRIVVSYGRSELVLLAAYDESGAEFSTDAMAGLAGRLGWRLAARHAYASVADLIVHAKHLPSTAEGFVIRFDDGLRLKVKGDEYKRIHALVSNCTPLGVWDLMRSGADMETTRKDLPEEFWSDYDDISGILSGGLSRLDSRIRALVEDLSGLSDKDIGLSLNSYPEDLRRYIFPYRKGETLTTPRVREMAFRDFRPAGNRLEGYTPSFAMNRVAEESN